MISGLNGMNSIDPMFNNGGSDLFSDPLGSVSKFGSVFNQAMAQAKTPADQAKVAYAEAKFNNLMSLSSMFADPSSPSSLLGMGSSLSGAFGNPFALPSWAYQLEGLLGPNSLAAQAMSIDQQASLVSQSMLNQGLNSLGGSFNSMI
jgi:hypothetical protein